MKRFSFLALLVLINIQQSCTIDDSIEDLNIEKNEVQILSKSTETQSKKGSGGLVFDDALNYEIPSTNVENPIQGDTLIVYIDYNDFFLSYDWKILRSTYNLSNVEDNNLTPEENFMNTYISQEGSHYFISNIQTTSNQNCGFVQRWEVNLNQYFLRYPAMQGNQPLNTQGETIRHKPTQQTPPPSGDLTAPQFDSNPNWINGLPYSSCF